MQMTSTASFENASFWPQDKVPPIIWSVAGTDSGGGAGLTADARAAAALGVHLCPVVAAVTAQNSRAVEQVFVLAPEQIQAQLDALGTDLRPQALKTGLLGSVQAVECVARCIDHLRLTGPVALVVDPVLRASSGSLLVDPAAEAAVLQAYRDLLLPRATLITPNEAEARRLLGDSRASVPALARGLLALGAEAVCITGGDSRPDAALALDYLATAQASGWLALPRLSSAKNNHGTGCTFASAAAAALARGFVVADALVLAKMLTWCALRDGHGAGAGAGPVRATPGFLFDRTALPVMGWDEALSDGELARWQAVLGETGSPTEHFGLYAITDQAERLASLAAAGLRHVQLRLKRGPGIGDAELLAAIRQSRLAVHGQRTTLWINDHWQLALADAADGPCAVHLGQEDWLGLSAAERQQLLNPGVELGMSSHSLWELARARGLAPRYIACGPVWPTTTKLMPWQPQGLANLAWWARMAGRPVIAIGGILLPQQVKDCAATGAAGACLVRALDGATDLQTFAEAWMQGRWGPSIQ
jgi:hydroxymethylpyrimidine kinase/phosphomethylpyrimidine kinase/thiamine-phosphate diphosphorylase